MDELTEHELAELVQQLHELVADLESQLAATHEGAKPVDLDEPIGRLSRMDAMQQQQMNRAHKRRMQLRVQQANAALKRAERGEYGECVFCGDAIGFKRLSVKPESPMCMPCQTEREG